MMNIYYFHRTNQLIQKNIDRLYALIILAFEEPDNSLIDANRHAAKHFPWGVRYFCN